MATLIDVNGNETTVTPQNGSDFSLAEMQKMVDGFIEIVYLAGGRLLVVNEEGLLRQMPVNDKASELANGMIVGPVVLCNESEIR